ncbi:MAG: DUF2330 domain-containing protein [Alphaproteobacteria bacterium]|nr:DUF2330 domain-containing protein [Alphaproteobacteria bacterium]
MIRLLLTTMVLITMSTPGAQAFCGFYVAKADADLFNEASKVIMARHENRTVMTMANDFKGDVKDFAIVIPVPTVITKSQVNVGDSKIIDHLDAYTAPRLVEYYDENPCNRTLYETDMMTAGAPMALRQSAEAKESAQALGVTIEESYTVGEYDILILSAEQSDGLTKWLNQEGYKMPKGAEKVLGSYIKQDMKFFVAKVNLDKFESSGYTYLRPLQVAYESEKFMLPVRLGTLNAKGDQDLLLFTLTKQGRVEPTNYRTTKIPTGDDIPLFVADEFGEFYKAMFAHNVKKENMKTVMLEYAWDMSWCDPCAADPLPASDLRKLGAWWIEGANTYPPGRPVPMQRRMIMPPGGGAVDTYVTRMHVRYNAETFPEDIMLQVTEDRENFQGRYVMRHPYKGEASCEEAGSYYSELQGRFEKEAKTLANLTGWDISTIRRKMEANGQSFDIKAKIDSTPWWEQMWD